MSVEHDALIRVQGLSRSFIVKEDRTFSVLRDVSFDVPRGKIVSILGASGCGKTTLLKILAGLDRTGGEAVQSPIARPGPQVGYLQQSERLLPWRTVLDNVALGLEMTGSGKSEARVAARKVLVDVGMADYEARYPSELSGGMTQRVLIARTFITRPSILLLDEPLGQLDIVARKALAKNIRDYVQQTAAAALLVTHSVEEAVFISDIVLTLSRRPARIVDRFILGGSSTQPDLVTIDRDSSFEVVLGALLKTLQPSDGQGATWP